MKIAGVGKIASIAKSKLLIVFGIGALGAGCVGGIDPALQDSPEYVLGWQHGCATGQARSRSFGYTESIRDDSRFETDRAYQTGWRQGFLECQDRSLINQPDALLGERGAD